ncbi:DUF2656 family protein [Vacuolonema iberomarrocanum]|uniref:DUF2656 family protein n=1 Tax=Vacuolonema iberomarrocanum TaxID=3454632 RepID=UPI003F6E25A2
MSASLENQGRMLLSHNFDVAPDQVPALSREAFADMFQLGLAKWDGLHCQRIDHPHWIVEIRFLMDAFSPSQIGDLCERPKAMQRSWSSFWPMGLRSIQRIRRQATWH